MKTEFAKDTTPRGVILKTLIIIAIPIIISNILESMMEVVDMRFIGTLGQTAMAGASTSINVIMLLMTLLLGVAIGMAAFISRAHGAGQKEKIPQILGLGLILGLIVSAILAVIGIFFSKNILMLLTHGNEAVSAAGATHLMPSLVGTVFIMLVVVLTIAFQSVGDSLTPMLVLLGCNVINAILNPVLISAIGLAGSAYATMICRACGAAALIVLMCVMKKHRTKTGLRFPTPKNFKFNGKLFGSICTVAGPSAFQSCIRNLGLMIMTSVVAFYGAAALSAYGVCTRTDAIGLMIAMGLGQAVCVLVGKCMGESNPDKATRFVRYAVFFNIIIMGIIAICYIAFAPQILAFFGVTGEATAIGLSWFSFIPVVSILMGLALTYGYAMNGAGRTWPGMLAAFTGQVVIPIGLSLIVVASGLPIIYVFIAVGLGIVANFFVDFGFYKQGGWKNQKLKM